MPFLSLGCYSNHTALHCAVYHLDRSLALERFIHLLVHKVLVNPPPLPNRNLEEVGMCNCMLIGE